MIIDVQRNAKGPQIILSRASGEFLIKLFEQEVPEILEGIVRINAVAREAGGRSKIAVSSSELRVDPVGACVGMKGSRVQAVVQELRGEKIDIVTWDSDPARFVCNAIQPAEVSRVIIDAATHTMQLIVNVDRLSLAIGKKGQNVRLASQLTGWRIDIHSESKVREMETRALASLSSIEGITSEAADALFKQGWRAAREVARTSPDELVGLPGIADVAAAERVVAAANRTADLEEKRRQQELEQQEAAAAEAAAAAAANLEAGESGEAKKPPAEGRA
jgi:N utilization substance protein A